MPKIPLKSPGFRSIALVAGLLVLAATPQDPDRARAAVVAAFIASNDCEEAVTGPKFAAPGLAIDGDAAPTCSPAGPSWLRRLPEIGVAALVTGDPNAYRSMYDPTQVNEKFRQLGAAVYQQFPTSAAPSRFDAKAIQLAFDRLYVKPSATIAGVKAQVVYDAVFRRTAESLALQLARIVQTKGFVDDAVAETARASKTPGFWAPGYYISLANELAGDSGREVSGRLLGTVVRRAQDGTLPLLLKLVEKVLADYDPSLLRKFKDPEQGLSDGKVAVRLSVSPPDFEYAVKVDGAEVACGGLCRRLRVKPGKRVFEVSGDGGSEASVTLDVSEKKREVVVQLVRKAWDDVEVQSEGPAIDVSLDGVLQGRTPLSLKLPLGRHVLATKDPCVAGEEHGVDVVLARAPAPIVFAALEKTAELRVVVRDGAGELVDGTWLAGGVQAPTGVPKRLPLCTKVVRVEVPGGVKHHAVALDEKTPARLEITPATPEVPLPAAWGTTGAQALGAASRVRVSCPPRGASGFGVVIGQDPFHLDSTVCAAAVFAGRFKPETGGEVQIVRTSGPKDWPAKNANGIWSTARYGSPGDGFRLE